MFRPGEDIAAAESPPHPTRAYGLHTAVAGRDADAVQHNMVAVFASFITLLCTFIGDELGLQFIRQIWPNLPPDAAAPRAGEATQ
jgi:hypothetical protein